jgi:hypothetical protein
MMFSENRRPLFRFMLQGEFSGLLPELLRVEAVRLVRGVLLHRQDRMLITSLPSTNFRRGSRMNWIVWDTAWSLFFSLIWFMTITHHPEARIADAHFRDEAFGG